MIISESSEMCLVWVNHTPNDYMWKIAPQLSGRILQSLVFLKKSIGSVYFAVKSDLWTIVHTPFCGSGFACSTL